MIHRYKPDAALELLAAVEHYEAERPGLGGEFLDAVDLAIVAIKEAPTRWPRIDQHARRYRLDRFPYHLVYDIKESVVVIIAVAHQHREPGYWKRLP
jgi:ParE-like toxin of type II ParDE toxin-antitoxin system